MQAGRPEVAMERLQRYLALVPYSPKEWQILAGWLGAAGRISEQREAQQNAELAYKNQVRQSRWIARFGDLKDAIPALENALQLDPTNQGALADRARMQP